MIFATSHIGDTLNMWQTVFKSDDTETLDVQDQWRNTSEDLKFSFTENLEKSKYFLQGYHIKYL